jgi:hypothetical protein
MILLSLHPSPVSLTSAFSRIRALVSRCAGLFPFRINSLKLVTLFCAQPHHMLFYRYVL